MALSGSARPGKLKPRSTVTVKTCYLLISSEFLPQGPRPNTCTYSCSESIFFYSMSDYAVIRHNDLLFPLTYFARLAENDALAQSKTMNP